jgi:hypothetical protein
MLWFLIDFKKATSADNPREFIVRELLLAGVGSGDAVSARRRDNRGNRNAATK